MSELKYSKEQIIDACKEAGLGILECNSLITVLGCCQPEATKPAQDLSAAILARQVIQDTNDTLREQYEALVQLKAENDQLRAALASPADALVAGDSETAKDAANMQAENIAVSVKTRVTNFGIGGAILVKDVHRIIDEEMHAINAASQAKEKMNG